MQITVSIPDEVATQVRARGLTPESYVEQLIEDALRTTATPAGRQDLETFFKEMAAHSEAVPQLSEEAFTRNSFYRDHD